uniref:Major facilitator superfamily (MFS) profile domain-containing protein n=1 Tax=Octopus bimaculoides TaxID=37653 RepID=A0A0L8HIA4_OCTBM|eukprot:XP_014772111.1 PREDICTED: MFS-type transporter SLC18B1-like isoform X3 [Octopus bimaculoides]
MSDSEKEPLIQSPPRRERLASERSTHSELSVHSIISSPDSTGCKICPTFLTELGYKEKLTVLFMCLITFVQCLCFSVLAPFFPKEAELKGLNSSETGMIFGVFELMIFLTAPIFGTYLTKFGILFTYISGCFVAGSCAIIFGVLKWCPAGNVFLAMCFLTRGVEALAVSAHLTASMAVIGYIFKERASLAIGFIEIFSGLGMMAGPPIGGVLYELGGFGLPFWTLGGITVTLAFISCLLMPSITVPCKYIVCWINLPGSPWNLHLLCSFNRMDK